MQIYNVKSLTDIFNAYSWITSSWSFLTVRHIFISTDWIFTFQGIFFLTFSFSSHARFIIFIIKCITKSEKSTWSRGFTRETSVCVLLTQGGMVCGRLLISGTELIVGNTCALRKGGKWLAHHWAFFLKKVCGAGRERNVTEDLRVRPITTEENCQVALVLNLQNPRHALCEGLLREYSQCVCPYMWCFLFKFAWWMMYSVLS